MSCDERGRDHEAGRAAGGDVAAARLDSRPRSAGTRASRRRTRKTRAASGAHAGTGGEAAGGRLRWPLARGDPIGHLGVRVQDTGSGGERSSSLQIDSTHRAPAARPARRCGARPAGRRASRRGRSARRRARRRGAPPTSASTSSPTSSASSGAAPASASARTKIARVRLGRADLGRGDRAVEQRVSPVRSSSSCSETSQLETATSRTPAARSARSAGTVSGTARSGAPPAALGQRVEVERRGERVTQHLRAGAAQRRQPGGVAPHPQVRAVVGDLGLHRAARLGLGDVDRRAARAAPRAAAARAAAARAACRGSRRDRTDRLPRHAGGHCTAPRGRVLGRQQRLRHGDRSRSCSRSSPRRCSTATSPAAATSWPPPSRAARSAPCSRRGCASSSG